jgi:ABC-type dipeptide/oligopeptide/nickel transport system ATPase component
VESGSPYQIFAAPRHDYTRRLVAALPKQPDVLAASLVSV